ncbi:hypothetical protein PFISCL1PPCAC_25510 [Pristionchus fissidentatus]|uniref:Ribosomal protein n=1 Tax=Pristionchus fissidentatus TaxID=1538716 RepID=A0AAV5WVI1_9BILA|nr:hypothetical protein PFISCL1PPCAC_25510 [Pristionchus fissidentatus]
MRTYDAKQYTFIHLVNHDAIGNIESEAFEAVLTHQCSQFGRTGRGNRGRGSLQHQSPSSFSFGSPQHQSHSSIYGSLRSLRSKNIDLIWTKVKDHHTRIVINGSTYLRGAMLICPDINLPTAGTVLTVEAYYN